MTLPQNGMLFSILGRFSGSHARDPRKIVYFIIYHRRLMDVFRNNSYADLKLLVMLSCILAGESKHFHSTHKGSVITLIYTRSSEKNVWRLRWLSSGL
jgi:hypothetical protein